MRLIHNILDILCQHLIHFLSFKFQDIAAGLFLSSSLLVVLVPLVDWLDGVLLTRHWSPAAVIVLSILVIVFYPNADKWTPTR